MTPPRLAPRIAKEPRIREIYWCDFQQDAQLPEFWKRRPVLVISKYSRLFGNVTMLPMSSLDQPGNKHAFPIVSPIDCRISWVICNYPTTVAVSRLSAAAKKIPRLELSEFDGIMRVVLNNFYIPAG